MARPSGFSATLAQRILKLVAKGLTDAQIAKKIGVSVTALSNWKGKHASFAAAVKEAKDIADELVEASLYQRACGYREPDIKIFCYNGEVIVKKYTKQHIPDVTACIFWLKNRQPARWREGSRFEFVGKDGAALQPAQVVVTLPANGREAKEEE